MSTNPFLVAHKFLERRTVTAGGTITAYRCVGYDSLQVTTVGARPWGVAETSGVIGEQITITTYGSCVVESGAAIAMGAAVTTDTSGRLVPATTGQFVFGHALGAVSAAARFLEVRITNEGVL
jgi:hypothetical protein